MRRPSASVLPISTVMPLRVLSTSSGRKALPETEFSTAGTSTRRRTFSFAAITIEASASTCAAPPMSFFMVSMPEAGLRSSPPLSKHTPLPTRVILGASALPQTRSIRQGLRAEARPTACTMGQFCRSSSSPSTTETLAPKRLPSAFAAAARSCGPMSEAGVLMRSRARKLASSRASTALRSARAGHSSAAGLPLAAR